MLSLLQDQLNSKKSWPLSNGKSAKAADDSWRYIEQARMFEAIANLEPAAARTWPQLCDLCAQAETLLKEPREWSVFNRRARLNMLHALVASLRHGQSAVEQERAAEYNASCKQLFQRVRALLRHGDNEFVHGLAMHHTPQHGPSWLDDATFYLKAEGPAPIPASPKPTASKPTTHDAPTDLDADLDEPAHDPFPAAAGQRWVIVGGNPSDKRLLALRDIYKLDSLEWIATDPNKIKRIDSVVGKMDGGHLDAIIVLQSFISHKVTRKLSKASKRSAVPVIWVEHGYGEAQITRALHRYMSS
jgi:hypothetical protein